MSVEVEAATAGCAESELIEGLRARIEAWRGSESRGRAMPEALWEEAAAAAQLLGVFRVARALSLNYETLKRRAGLTETDRAPGGRADFLELTGLGAPVAHGAGAEAVVEVLSPDGAKLTLRLPGQHLAMAAALIEAFRGRA